MTTTRADRNPAVVAGVAVMIAVTLLDIAEAKEHVFVTALMLGPLIALLGAPYRQVAALAVVAVATALVSAAWNDNFGTVEYILHAVLVAAGGAAATIAAAYRDGEQQQGARMALLAALGEVSDGSLSTRETARRITDVLVGTLGDAAAIDATDSRLASSGDESLIEDGISVDLQTRGRVLGTLRVAVAPGRPRLDEDDVEFLRVASGRAALALDNAGLSSDLAAAEARLAGALSSLAEAVTIQEPGGRLVYANQAAAALLGYATPEDVLSESGAQIVARFDTYMEDGSPLRTEALPGRRVLAGDEPEPLLLRARNIDTGEERWRIVKASPVFGPDGEVRYAVNVIEDVTEVKRAELAQRILSEAGRLLSSTLDEREALARIAEVAVPAFADWCVVHVPGEGGAIEIVGLAGTDPEQVEQGRRRWESAPARMDDPAGIATILRGGASRLVADVSDELLESVSRSPEHGQALLGAGMRSIIAVPMRLGARTTGVITFVTAGSMRRYGRHDLATAEELARRAAIAAENARLYQERSATAEILQRELMPPQLPTIEGWGTATMYRAAGDVGGDFYDAFPVDGGWVVIVGDVAGRGPAAASLTALARYTLRTAAMLTGDAAAALGILNRTLLERGAMALCSVCAVTLRDGEAAVLCAGHPPPVLVRSDGTPVQLEVGGPLLGVLEEPKWEPETVALEAGEQLVLYTDGVLDAAGPSGRFGERRLATTLDGASGADDVVARIRAALEAFETGSRRDDTAVLALERLGVPAAHGAANGRFHRARLPHAPGAPAAARRALDAWLAETLDEDRLADACLLVSELVTNGVRHAQLGDDAVIDLEVAVEPERVRVQVSDEGPGFEPPTSWPPPPDSVGGRGLFIVDQLASRWGVDRGGSTCVWFELDRP